MQSQIVTTNGIRLHVMTAGPDDGPLVLLLHGFPEFWYGWRHQIDVLASHGFRVWAPDQRGYNLSDKPKGIAAYALDTLAADVTGLCDAAGVKKGFVVGHDWGAVVAWQVATMFPDRVTRLVAINGPHMAVMKSALWKDPAQLMRSRYVFSFQAPWFPEYLTPRKNWRMLTRVLQTSSLPSTFSDADLAMYRTAWSQPRAYTSMLNWYRAAFRCRYSTPTDLRITVPTLIIWGTQDQFLGEHLAYTNHALCSNSRLELITTATHWVHHEETDIVNALIRSFLQEPRPGS